MDTIFKKKYKNADYEVIVEEDCITTAKIYIDGELVQMQEYSLNDGNDVPFNKKNLDKICSAVKNAIDEEWDKNFSEIKSLA